MNRGEGTGRHQPAAGGPTCTKVSARAGWTGAAALVAFGPLVLFMTGADGEPFGADRVLLTWSAAHRPPAAAEAARLLTDTGTGAIPYLLLLLAGAVMGRTLRQRLLAAAYFFACLAVGQAVRYGLMTLVARPRPPRADWATQASGWAFPSGHTTTAALTAGLLVLAVSVRAPRARPPLVLLICCWGMLVGLTRVYLGVHWLSDVLGGWLFAVAWLGLGLRLTTRYVPTAALAPTSVPVQRHVSDHAPQDPGRRG